MRPTFCIHWGWLGGKKIQKRGCSDRNVDFLSLASSLDADVSLVINTYSSGSLTKRNCQHSQFSEFRDGNGNFSERVFKARLLIYIAFLQSL